LKTADEKSLVDFFNDISACDGAAGVEDKSAKRWGHFHKWISILAEGN
jgi:hypothetical protein